MSILEIAAKKKRKVVNDTELSILGVDTSKPPSIATFPKQFNKEGFQLWSEMLNSDWYSDLKSDGGSATDIWYEVIKHYMKTAADEGLFPFNQTHQQSNNDIAMSFLTSARIRTKRFFDETEFFDKVKVNSVDRSYVFLPQSFTVISTAELKSIEDPTFISWMTSLPSPGFVNVDGVFKKNLQANVDISLEFLRGKKTRLTVSVFCHTPLSLPDYNKLPTKSKLTQFAEKTIWLPIVRAHKFNRLTKRLF